MINETQRKVNLFVSIRNKFSFVGYQSIETVCDI